MGQAGELVRDYRSHCWVSVGVLALRKKATDGKGLAALRLTVRPIHQSLTEWTGWAKRESDKPSVYVKRVNGLCDNRVIP